MFKMVLSIKSHETTLNDADVAEACQVTWMVTLV